MEAKDTVMNETLIQTWCLEFVQPGELDLNAKLKEFAEAQAEISFKAGKRKAVEFIESYLVTTVHPEGDMHHIDDKEWQSVKQRLLKVA